MGCSESKTAEQIANDIKTDKLIEELSECLDAFMISADDVELMKSCFRRIDLTHDGSIDVAEIEVHLKTERVPFNERVLRMYDSDKSGQLEFPEFLLMCWTYCTMDAENLGMLMSASSVRTYCIETLLDPFG